MASPMSSPASLVHARGLTKRYSNGFTAVDGVDFDVLPGRAFGFLGPNGAGKTSTMRMIACSSPISEGDLSVIGMDPRTQAREIKARLGVVPQMDNLDTELTVRENLEMYARYFDIPGDVARNRATELLEFVQLDERAKDQVEPLSGGMKRRLTIARALINEPELVILDEPTTGLDPQARHLLWERLYQLKRRGATLIITTHYMDEAEQLCDHLVVMDKAKIVAEGSPRHLIDEHSTREVLELRLTDQVRDSLNGQFEGLAERVEQLPDRLLLYTADGERTLEQVNQHGGCLPPPDRPLADRVAMTVIAASGRVWQRNWLVYRRLWHRSLAFGFLQPVLFLTAMGLGLGTLIPPDTDAFGGVDYVDWLGPGLLAAMAMQTATFESTYPIMNKIMWGRNYEAILSTPLGIRHIVLGELGWSAFRIASLATVFLVVLFLFGIPRAPLAILAIPFAVLTGLAFSACLIAFTATQKNDVGFSAIFRFVINPLFLFSGTFFPLTQLPEPLQLVAWATPLFHGVELVRGAILDTLDPVTAPLHLAYLLAMFTIGATLAERNLTRRMAG
jgi:lipooligosaccharide transport system ATP-binding protein